MPLNTQFEPDSSTTPLHYKNAVPDHTYELYYFHPSLQLDLHPPNWNNMPENRAAWLPAKMAYPYTIDEAPMPAVDSQEVIIRVRTVAINPADVVIQDMGIFYEKYPIIPGVDVAGEIVEVGSDVKALKIGDRVTGFLNNGAFQLYCAANQKQLIKLPNEVELKEACVIPLGFATAAVCLFERDMLGLSYPSLEKAAPNGKLLVVWGGSSSLGSCGIQQAKSAGYEIAATASKHNFDYCKRLGADHVFDHTSSTVIEDIVEALKGKDCVGVFCCINAKEVVGKCGEISDRLGGEKLVAIPLPPAVPVPDPVPSDVKVVQCWHSGLEESKVVEELFSGWLPAALGSGVMKCQPEPYVVGKGLEKVQDAVDTLRKGVSAKKVVVEIA